MLPESEIPYHVPKSRHTPLFKIYATLFEVNLRGLINSMAAYLSKLKFCLFIMYIDNAISCGLLRTPNMIPKPVSISGFRTVTIPPEIWFFLSTLFHTITGC